jgi:hypothetical protein
MTAANDAVQEEMMIELASAFKASSEAVSLIATLAKIISENTKRQPNDPTAKQPLGEVLRRLQIEGIRLSKNLENRIRLMADRIPEYGLSPSLSIEQQIGDLSWYNFVTRARLKAIREECQSIRRELTSFIDDATAMLICQNQQQIASEAFKAGLAAKRQLDTILLDQTVSIKALILAMLDTATKVTAELEAA